MMQTPIALIEAFPRYHQFCDRCDCEVGGTVRYIRTERETAAGSFHRTLCVACEDKLGEMSVPRRRAAEVRAMVKHAARYSPEFGHFVAEWFGVRQ